MPKILFEHPGNSMFLQVGDEHEAIFRIRLTNRMKLDLRWRSGVKVIGVHGLYDVVAELIQRVALCDDIFIEAIGNEAPVLFLNNVEDNLCARHDNDTSQYALLAQGTATRQQLRNIGFEREICIATNWITLIAIRFSQLNRFLSGDMTN
jgi:hypothetical protein